jgi:hypothetical protein
VPKLRPKKKKQPQKKTAAYPAVSSRVGIDEERSYTAQMSGFLNGLQTISAKFPFQFYEIIDDLTLIDPYVNKYVYTTIALGNTRHKIELNASSQSRADEAIQFANDFAARCFPLAGGLDGVVNGLLGQVARTGGMCVEWEPDAYLTQVKAAHIIPIKTLRWRYDDKGQLQLCQMQNVVNGKDSSISGLVPLNMAQTTYHVAMIRDSNPYPIPPTIAALESCMAHRKINQSIAAWMDKVSALGVLMASVEPPPRDPGESQATYDAKAKRYLDAIADNISSNMSQGIGVGYNNIEFSFANTQASAQGAKDILQIVLQGLFGALQRDPIFFGWNFSTTEALARIVYEEMQQGLLLFQAGVKRSLEHGHRLNFALGGFSDVGISVKFNSGRSIDAFRDSEARYMDAQSAIAQAEAGFITVEEGRAILGHNEAKANSGEFIASFQEDTRQYVMLPRPKSQWRGVDNLRVEALSSNVSDFQDENDYEVGLTRKLSKSLHDGVEAFFAWLLISGEVDRETFIREGLARIIGATEQSIDRYEIASLANSYLSDVWSNSKLDRKLYPDFADRSTSISKNLSTGEKAAIAYLALTVEPYYAGSFLSQSPGRQQSLESFLRLNYNKIDFESHAGLNLLKARLNDLADSISKNAGHLISDAASGRAHNWGQVYALDEQVITEFVIDGPRDDRKCAYCWTMLDRVFSVETEKRIIEEIVASNQEDIIKVAAPVAMRYRDNLDGLRSTSDIEIHYTGLAAPPYHNNCRDYIVGRSK